MEENNTASQGMTFLDVMKLLGSKLKSIFCIVLISTIVGAAAGVVWSFVFGDTYGTQVDFEISGAIPDSYVISLLESDSFAEKLLLDENGLPANMKSTKEYAKAIEAKNNLTAALENEADLKQEFEHLPTLLKISNEVFSEKQKHLEELRSLLAAYLASPNEKVDPTEKIAYYEEKLTEATAARDEAESKYRADSNRSIEIYADIKEAEEASLLAKDAAYDAAEALLSTWRKDENVKAQMKIIKKSISYEYSNPNATSGKMFLYVSIDVPKDAEFANRLMEGLIANVPDFVVENIPSLADSKTLPECKLASTFNEIDATGNFGPVGLAVKFGLVFFALSAVASCCGFILVESAKRNSNN